MVELIGPDGNVFVTEEQGGGKVMWEDLQVATSVVTANQKGVVSLPKDPRVSDGKVAHVTITVPTIRASRRTSTSPFGTTTNSPRITPEATAPTV